MRHDVSQSSALQELHDDPEFVSHQVAVVHLHHVLVMVIPHDHHLQLPWKRKENIKQTSTRKRAASSSVLWEVLLVETGCGEYWQVAGNMLEAVKSAAISESVSY